MACRLLMPADRENLMRFLLLLPLASRAAPATVDIQGKPLVEADLRPGTRRPAAVASAGPGLAAWAANGGGDRP